MRIFIVTPNSPTQQAGNQVTAQRWARLLRQSGHSVRLVGHYRGQTCDLLIALHARKSASSVRAFRELHPHGPLILALTGTDLYHDIRTSLAAQQSLDLASRLVLLQVHGLTQLPGRLAHKVRVIYQSAAPPKRSPAPLKHCFEVCVVGHLRAVKDPFRAALAARRLPEHSRIRVFHYGKAIQPRMEERALAEMRRNPRYQWLGELPRWKVGRRIARARLLVQSSRIEGGANVLSEALAAGVPVLASRISGSLGVLGEHYPGYFRCGDTRGLVELLQRAETNATFYQQLKVWCERRAPLVAPASERQAWQELLGEFSWEACSGTAAPEGPDRRD